MSYWAQRSIHKFKVQSCALKVWIFRFLSKAQNDNVDFCLFTKSSKRQAHKFNSKIQALNSNPQTNSALNKFKPTNNPNTKSLSTQSDLSFFRSFISFMLSTMIPTTKLSTTKPTISTKLTKIVRFKKRQATKKNTIYKNKLKKVQI